MTYDEMKTAINQAVNMHVWLDGQADALARIVLPRLGKCSSSTLKALKIALRNYNIQTQTYKGGF